MMTFRVLSLLWVFCLLGSTVTAKRYTFSKPKLGTVLSILIDAKEADYKEKITSIYNRVDELNSIFSDYDESSELMRLCRDAGQREVFVSNELFDVLYESKVLYYSSEGAFDPTVGTWTKEWRKYRDGLVSKPSKRIPGYDLVVLNEETKSVKFLENGISLDLGGIAKGYIADQICKMLKGFRVDNYLVGIGGELIAGLAPLGEPKGWKIAIQDPENKKGGVLYLKQQALSTSGASYQFVKDRNIVVGHIVNPKNGKGIDNHFNVSVIAGSSMLADGLATTLRLIGRDKAEALFDNRDYACLFVGKDFREINKIGNFPPVEITGLGIR